MKTKRNYQALLAVIAAATFTTSVRAAPEAVPGEFVVQLRADSFQGLSAGSRGLDSVEPLGTGTLLVKSSAGIEAVRKLPAVARVEPNYIYRRLEAPDWTLENNGQTNCGGERGTPGIDVKARDAWKISTGSPDVVVAVIDTGIDINHPRLREQILVNEAELRGKPGIDDDENGYVDDTYGFDFTANSGLTGDNNGHGTFCAGQIAASADASDGIAGLAPRTRILPVKFLDADGSGTLANAIRAIDYAVERGARVLSNSWGGADYSALLEDAVKRAESKGVLFVAAAGNDGSNLSRRPVYPAAFPEGNVVSVAAVTNNGYLAPFSNFGAKVHLAAPGGFLLGLQPGGGVTCESGTSMAAPLVAATAALVLAKEPGLSAEEVKARLMTTATKLSDLEGKIASGGMINALEALQK